jgi:hypothetical protein
MVEILSSTPLGFENLDHRPNRAPSISGHLHPGATLASLVDTQHRDRHDRATSDIDLMVIADDLDYAALYSALPAAEEALARPISPSLMAHKEWQRKRSETDSFAARIAAQPKLFLIGSEDDLG